jgi:hypothetical protein
MPKNIVSITFLLVFPFALLSQDLFPEAPGEVLLGGYDPMSYFDGEVRKGVDAFQVRIHNRIVKFSSQKNHERFQQGGQKLLPAYGGWCAYSMSEGQFVRSNPHNYLVQNGRLFLFSDKSYLKALEKWKESPVFCELQADRNYYIKFFPEASLE